MRLKFSFPNLTTLLLTHYFFVSLLLSPFQEKNFFYQSSINGFWGVLLWIFFSSSLWRLIFTFQRHYIIFIFFRKLPSPPHRHCSRIKYKKWQILISIKFFFEQEKLSREIGWRRKKKCWKKNFFPSHHWKNTFCEFSYIFFVIHFGWKVAFSHISIFHALLIHSSVQWLN